MKSYKCLDYVVVLVLVVLLLQLLLARALLLGAGRCLASPLVPLLLRYVRVVPLHAHLHVLVLPFLVVVLWSQQDLESPIQSPPVHPEKPISSEKQ